MLKYMWRGPATPSAKQVFKKELLENIPEEVSKFDVLNQQAKQLLNEGFEKARKRLRQDINSLSADHRGAVSEMGRLERLKMSRVAELRRMEQAVEQGSMEYVSALSKLEDEIVDIDSNIERFRKITDAAEMDIRSLRILSQEAHNAPKEFIKRIKENPRLSQRFTALDDLAHATEEQLRRRFEIFKAVSPNVDSPKKFMREYIEKIKPLPDSDELKMTWLLNPKNKSTLMDLQRNPKAKKYMTKLLSKQPEAMTAGMAKSMKDLKGQSASSISKKLGVSMSVAGAIAAALGLYSWFDDTGPVQQDAAARLSDLTNFKAGGVPGAMVANVISALKAQEAAYKKAQSQMGGKKAQAAITEYVESVARTQNVIEKVLPRWQMVIDYADNPDAARSAGRALEALNADLAANLGALEAEVGETAGGAGGGMMGQKEPAPQPKPQKISQQRILGVQEYLSTKNPYVGATGRLDRETVRMLKELENEYNSLGNTTRFTGLLVDLSKKHLIEGADLREIDREMNKYR